MDMLATDLAEYLVRKGVPFRETHHISGTCVRMAEEQGLSGIHQLGLEKLQSVDKRFEKDVMEVFDFEKSVELRESTGGTARKCVLKQIAEVTKALL
jgi:argininosuccinate lyase